MTKHKEEVLEFWNSRADFGANAGSNDFMLKELEERALAQRIPAGAHVLDIGCGIGSTLIRLATDKGCTGVGLDYADNLLQLAGETLEGQGLRGCIELAKGDVTRLPGDLGAYDHILTQRCLINLETYAEQQQAFRSIVQHLSIGGMYYMVEAFNDGNHALNAVREPLGLPPMISPWHNLFFNLKEVLNWETDYPVELVEVAHFASTYYFLSRVVYAKLATDRGEELRYDSEINRLSLALPPLGEFGATKLLVWRRTR